MNSEDLALIEQAQGIERDMIEAGEVEGAAAVSRLISGLIDQRKAEAIRGLAPSPLTTTTLVAALLA